MLFQGAAVATSGSGPEPRTKHSSQILSNRSVGDLVIELPKRHVSLQEN